MVVLSPLSSLGNDVLWVFPCAEFCLQSVCLGVQISQITTVSKEPKKLAHWQIFPQVSRVKAPKVQQTIASCGLSICFRFYVALNYLTIHSNVVVLTVLVNLRY